MNKSITYKIVLLGNSGVGKSSIAHKYVRDNFCKLREPTIGAAFLTKKHIINNIEYNLEIWDTAGQERYRSLTPMYYRGSHFAIIVYDITSNQSLFEAKRWVNEIKRIINKNIVIILVGNKYDLINKRQVEKNLIEEYCKENEILFMEVSAKTGENINNVFELLLKNRIIENIKDTEVIKINENNNNNINYSCC